MKGPGWLCEGDTCIDTLYCSSNRTAGGRSSRKSHKASSRVVVKSLQHEQANRTIVPRAWPRVQATLSHMSTWYAEIGPRCTDTTVRPNWGPVRGTRRHGLWSSVRGRLPLACSRPIDALNRAPACVDVGWRHGPPPQPRTSAACEGRQRRRRSPTPPHTPPGPCWCQVHTWSGHAPTARPRGEGRPYAHPTRSSHSG